MEHVLFNSEISDDEIITAVKSLKPDKSVAGLLSPAHFLYGIEQLLPFIRILFNRLFRNGEFPSTWSRMLVIPLHKKGSLNNPDNYRGIALGEVLGKIYVSVLTKRITFYADAYNKLLESQSGFRSGYWTIDNAYVLYSLVSKYLNHKRKYLYVCFVDFKKAFDSVDRCILYEILRKNGLKGNLFKATIALYQSVKACVKSACKLSLDFNCPIGLRQGCSLSPILFALFINELHSFMLENDVRGIQVFPSALEIFILMFADDIALIADTVRGLQMKLDILKTFCIENKLTVNVDKTKVLVFKRGGNLSRRENWKFGEQPLEIVNGYTYVGIYFSNRLSFSHMAEANVGKARKVLAQLFYSFDELNCIPFHTFFKVFDSKVTSVLLYGSEIWGLQHIDNIEKVHIHACKRYLNVPENSCNDAIMGDLGRFPLYITTAKRCIKYWLRIVKLPSDRYVRLCYEMLKYFDEMGHVNWVTYLRTNLFSNGFGYIWQTQTVNNEPLFINRYLQCLKDQCIQTWQQNWRQNRKLFYYRDFKITFNLETYIKAIDIEKFRKCLICFRSSSHSLMIEKGRHYNIDKEFRTCIYCESIIEDEFHFAMKCPLYNELRLKFLPAYYIENPTIYKFMKIMSTSNTETIRNFAMYLFYAFKERQHYINARE